MEELALQAERAGCRRTPGRRRPGGRWPADAPGSGACGPSRARTRSSVLSAKRPLGLEVRDRAARVVGVGGHPRAHAAVAAERRVDRARARRRAALDQREVLARDPPLAQHLPAAPRAPPRSRARTSSPDVSRSSRCTTPGRAGSGPPATRPASACTSVPCGVPVPRVDDDAGRLVDDQQVRRPRRRRGTAPAGPPAPAPAPARRPSPPRPRPARGASAAPRPSTRHAAGVDQPLRARARADCAGQEDVEALARRLGRHAHLTRSSTSTRSSDADA